MTTTRGGQDKGKRRHLGPSERLSPARPPCRMVGAHEVPRWEGLTVNEFEGKSVLVTGCGRVRGMGRAIAVAFARAGADVVATDIAAGGTRNENEEGLEEIRLGWKGLDSLAGEIQGLGRSVLTLVGDVSRAADAERFVSEALARFGRVDVLVNNAAAPHGADRRLLWEVPEEAWDLVLDVNLKGTFLMSRAVIPHMLSRRSGRIINMASVSGKRGTPRRGASTRAEWQDKARTVEDLGYSVLLVPDHLAAMLATLPAVMSAADATTSLRVGTNVLNNDLRHPVLLAREAATMDVLTDGRLELGLGAGYMRIEYEQAGLRFDRGGVRVERLAEAIAIIKGLLGGAEVNFA